jgi:hypothetical protein
LLVPQSKTKIQKYQSPWSVSDTGRWNSSKVENLSTKLQQKESHMKKSSDGLQLSVIHAVKSPNLPLDFV